MRQLLFFFHFTSVEELSFRKAKRFVEGQITDPEETLVCLQRPRAFHGPRITGSDVGALPGHRELAEILTLPFPSWVTLGKFFKLVKPPFPYL